jgi:hypothetical protein
LKSEAISFSEKCEKVLMQRNAVNAEKIISGWLHDFLGHFAWFILGIFFVRL